MASHVVIASNNTHKLSEISHALSFTNWEFKTLKDMGVDSNPVEDAQTFQGNARIKALAAAEACPGCAVLADDSGLVVDALDGRPGVLSARYAGDHVPDAVHNEKLLSELKDIPFEKRTARFVCALVYIDENGNETCVEGTVEGRIGFEPKGSDGFGYDPFFFAEAYNFEKTLAEVSQSEKELVSHRGNALRALAEKLKEA